MRAPKHFKKAKFAEVNVKKRRTLSAAELDLLLDKAAIHWRDKQENLWVPLALDLDEHGPKKALS